MLDKEFGANCLVTGKPLNFNHGSTSVSLATERTMGSAGVLGNVVLFRVSFCRAIELQAWAAIENPFAPHDFDCYYCNLILHSILE